MTFIVAEIGVNWDGDFELLDKMIKKCKKIGFDAIKFQSFNEALVKNHPEKIRLLKSTITYENIEEINKISKSNNMEWFCTPMFTEAVSMLEPFVSKYKIREFDGRTLFTNKISNLLKKALETKKELIISSQNSPKNVKFVKKKRTKWLYCVPKYPCSLEDIEFSNLKDFDGYSNHCTEIIAPLTAAILGSNILEIHITSDKSKDFVDNNVSLDYFEAEKLLGHIHLVEKIKK